MHLVEPTAAVPHNNRLSEAQGDVNKAELAVLTMLSELLRANLPDLATALEALVRMDVVSRGCAHLIPNPPWTHEGTCQPTRSSRAFTPSVSCCPSVVLGCFLSIHLFHMLTMHVGTQPIALFFLLAGNPPSPLLHLLLPADCCSSALQLLDWGIKANYHQYRTQHATAQW